MRYSLCYLFLVYRFDENQSKWLERATGNLILKFVESFKALGIQVTDEASINTIFGNVCLCLDEVVEASSSACL